MAKHAAGLVVVAALALCASQAAPRAPPAAASEPKRSAAAAPPWAVAPFDAQQARNQQEAWAQHLGLPREIPTAIGLSLALIPPGEFTMGSPPDEAGRHPQAETPHTVRIARPFYIALHEVTQDEFEHLMGYNPSYRAARVARMKQNFDVDTSRFPVERVSWIEAVEFCRRLSELPEEKAAGRMCRLPTEAEWEYACRAGAQTPFPFGTVLDGRLANVNGKHPYGTDAPGPSLNRPTTIGSYPPNAFGLFDMIGNKWEWCADWFAADYDAKAPAEDPQGPEEGAAKVIRGGAWRYPPVFCRSAMRYAYDPRIRAYDLGFRVALSAVASSGAADRPKPENPKETGQADKPQETPAAGEPMRARAANNAAPTRGAAWISPSTGMEFVWVEALGIWVGKYETTNGEYREKDAAHDSGKLLDHSLNEDRQPVAMVGFEDAMKYADWLTSRDQEQGRLPEGYRYRLPSEEEWLAFARCGEALEFPWGNSWPPSFGNYRGQEAQGRGDKIANHKDEYPAACDVEKSGSNRWGLYGVGGNAWEACAEDRTAEEPGSWRGGSWDSGTPGLLRCTFRSVGIPTYRFINYGFRLVLSPPTGTER